MPDRDERENTPMPSLEIALVFGWALAPFAVSLLNRLYGG